ncbi:hypothetical protein [Pseudomonas brassicacearum]|uniref:hypothetical protein n=1 Tax=Pseudomonas brassicacearum TaxID=930166 RepID=UPI000F48A792|nr:hypothetical protein [Pseudomonas brassicacearum]
MSLHKVWEKVNLPRGDLQLLDTSHASGVLRLTQSDYGIDQTNYFRHVVFVRLAWYPIDDKEMASANFKFLINGQDCGVFRLELSHKPSWESNQRNYTTGLHWGAALGVIQNEQLIGKTLTIYDARNEAYDYQIEIR